MSSQTPFPNLSREELFKAVVQAVYENSTMAVFYHTAIAEKVGLGASDEKALLLLSGRELSPGDIAQYCGLTTASVTSLIDRLESKGFVERIRDQVDRRRVTVKLNKARFTELSRLLESMQGEFADLFETYSQEQMATILDYLTRTTERSREALAKINTGLKKGSKSKEQVAS